MSLINNHINRHYFGYKHRTRMELPIELWNIISTDLNKNLVSTQNTSPITNFRLVSKITNQADSELGYMLYEISGKTICCDDDFASITDTSFSLKIATKTSANRFMDFMVEYLRDIHNADNDLDHNMVFVDWKYLGRIDKRACQHTCQSVNEFELILDHVHDGEIIAIDNKCVIEDFVNKN